MLVLARQRGQSIMIGDEIKVAIVDVQGDKVKLRVIAPKHLPIDHRNTYDSINTEKTNSSVGEFTYVNEPITSRINLSRGKNNTVVLDRQYHETIMIGDEIEVAIVNVGRGNVRLGIAAPKRISIHRQEIYDAMTTCFG